MREKIPDFITQKPHAHIYYQTHTLTQKHKHTCFRERARARVRYAHLFHPTPAPSLSLAARSFARSYTHTNFQIGCAFLFLNLLASKRTSKVSLSVLCHALENIILFSVGCSGTYSLLMAAHNMPIESIIAVDFLMIATIVLFFYVFARMNKKNQQQVDGKHHARSFIEQKFVHFIRK